MPFDARSAPQEEGPLPKVEPVVSPVVKYLDQVIEILKEPKRGM